MGDLILFVQKSQKYYTSFCLSINDDLTYSARICRKTYSPLSKFEFYPYVLLTSCIFLLVTLSIYTVFSSKLLTHYTRLMRHLCMTLFAAFLILSINQFHHFAGDYPSTGYYLCPIFG